MTWLQDFVSFASANLTTREREVLWSRGVSSEQMDLFQIGHLDKTLPKGVSEHFLWWSKKGEKLGDMLVFPLTTALGEIRGVQFRHVAREQKGYIDYFLDHREPCLFGLGQAIESIWDTNAIYLVEGAFDLLPVQRAIPFVVSTMTAYVSNQTARLFRRLVKKVWVGYDSDPPGKKGSSEFLEKHGRDFEVYIVTYPKAVNGRNVKDPGEIWEEWGDSQMVPFIRSQIEQSNLF